MHQDPTNRPDLTEETPLQGWKEIAAFLERDESTARRWEREAALPVRRHRTDRRSSVYAYPCELKAWRDSRPPASADSAPADEPPLIRRWGWGAVAALVVVGGFLGFLRSSSLDPVAEAGAAGPGLHTREIYEGVAGGTSVSPDGNYLSQTDWSRSGEIGIRDLRTGEFRRLGAKTAWGDGFGEAYRSIFSPDGKQIAYNWLTDRAGELRYELRVIDAFGDSPKARTVYFNPSLLHIQPDGWTSDGRLLVQFQRSDWSFGIGFVSVASGELESLQSLRVEISGLQLSADGRWIAYSAAAPGDERNHDVYLLAADGSAEKRATQHRADDFLAAFAPDGKTLLFVSDRSGTYSLWGASLSPAGDVGTPQILIRDVGSIGPMGVLPDGSFVYQKAMGSVDLYSAEIELSSGRILREPKIVATQYQGTIGEPFRLSPDGGDLAYIVEPPAFQIGLRDTPRRLMIRNLASGREREVPVEGVRLRPYYGLLWSPEGGRILSVTQDQQDRWGVVEIDLGDGTARQLRGAGEKQIFPVGWLDEDGKRFVHDAKAGGEATIETVEPGRGTGDVLYSTKRKISGSTLSRQRDQIAWREIPGPDEEIKVMPVAGGDARVVFQPNDDFSTGSITWAPDGKSLLIVGRSRADKGPSPASDVWIIPLDGKPAFKTGLSAEYLRRLSVHPDGKTVFFLAGFPDPSIFRTENYLPGSGGTTE